MEGRTPTARVERAAREDWDAATANRDRSRRALLREYVPAAGRLSADVLERQMALGVAIADEAAGLDDIPAIAFRYEQGKRRHQHLVTAATRIWVTRHQSRMTLSRTRSERWVAAAGTPDSFRSEWERRLARALDRLGIVWQYEQARLRYSDGTMRDRAYIPDFTIAGMDATFVEVKGPAGVDAGDAWKMRRVLKANPWATILLWDASTIEYIEDCERPAQVVALGGVTRFV